ncbi:26343_t:CDS:2 [Gigaspora rosea]|nr:26343_t:CDS:2 [Gigaspora rosea]
MDSFLKSYNSSESEVFDNFNYKPRKRSSKRVANERVHEQDYTLKSFMSLDIPTQSCSSTISYYNAAESFLPFSMPSSEEPAILATSVKVKPPKIETLYSFLNFQSFDGLFLPSEKFYSWFGKNDFKDFEIIRIKNERVLCLALAMAYLELIMFETFKEECEMCYEKSKKALKKEVDGDEQKINEILEKAKEWVNKWANE